ncbi:MULTISPECIES: phosphatase PAP2 family protein [unclassified Acinetobacter]|uniref:phosphatase PAP2 family protein n=1 Tax=unclassified Acinetobacter TaxID=196816 RepID=UPI001D0E212F|nr:MULTISPECIES: phosphatase PAP2 family protein [unclassified Acinetobacter]
MESRKVALYLEKFDKYNLVLLFSTALLMLIFIPIAGSLDQMLSLPWVNHSGYYLRENQFLVKFGHEFLKNLVIIIAMIHVVLWIKFIFQKSFSPLRSITGVVVIGMMISISVIGIFKSQSVHACPWTLLRVHANHIDWLKSLHVHGKCFPGGHASAGFSLLILYFAYRPFYPKLARYGLILALVMGSLMSTVQMVRGAHFLSHNLWSFWWSWLIDFMVYKVWQMFWPNYLKDISINKKFLRHDVNH